MLDVVAFLPVLLAIFVVAWVGGGLAGLRRDSTDGDGDGGTGPSGWHRPTPSGPLPSAGPADLARSA